MFGFVFGIFPLKRIVHRYLNNSSIVSSLYCSRITTTAIFLLVFLCQCSVIFLYFYFPYVLFYEVFVLKLFDGIDSELVYIRSQI